MTKEETRMPLPLLLPLASIEEELEAAYGEEEEDDDDESLFSIDFNFNFKNNYKGEEEVVPYYYYVAVGGQKSESSMDALLWTLSHAAVTRDHDQSLVLVIVHVFPPIRFIPSPIGMLPKNKVSPKMVGNYMALEIDRRRKLLDKYVDACSSAQVKTDIMLIESDTVSKAILDLIPTHQNIRNLVVGTTKSSLRKLRSKKGSGIASQILRNAPQTSCNIKIICKGKEVIDDTMFTGSTSSRSSNANSLSTQDEDDHQEQRISTDYNKHEYSRPAVKSPSSLNGYKAMWWGKPKPSQITA